VGVPRRVHDTPNPDITDSGAPVEQCVDERIRILHPYEYVCGADGVLPCPRSVDSMA